MQELGTFLKSTGNSASLGTAKYPAAGVMWLVRKLQGQGLSYEEALNEVKSLQKQDEAESPLASAMGSVTGAVATAPMVGSGSVLMQMLRGGTMGAVQGATQDEGNLLDNTLRGASLGVLTTGAGAAAGKAVTAASKKRFLDAARRKGVDPKDLEKLSEIPFGTSAWGEASSYLSGLSKTQAANFIKRNLSNAVSGGLAGGTLGAATSYFQGQDPTQGALFGASLGAGYGGLAKMKLLTGKAAGDQAARAVNVLSRTGRIGSGRAETSGGGVAQLATEPIVRELATPNEQPKAKDRWAEFEEPAKPAKDRWSDFE